MLSKENRLTDDYDFKRVRRLSKAVSGPYFNIAVAKQKEKKSNLKGESRFGFVISKKTEKTAVGRNRIKRMLREIVKHHIDKFPRGLDVVLIVKRGIITKNYEEVSSSFNKVLSKISFH